MKTCDFCGKEADTEGTSITGCYCIDCLRLTRSECLDAIRRIQRRNVQNVNYKGKVTKEQYDAALENLMHPPDSR